LPKLEEALGNLLIAIGMGWDLDGVVAQAQAILEQTHADPPKVDSSFELLKSHGFTI
jgi:hypothetical protein